MSASPWRRSTLGLLLAGHAVGVAGIVISWWGASGEYTLEDQVRWVSLGVIALLATGVTAAVFLREARIAIADETQRTIRRLRRDRA